MNVREIPGHIEFAADALKNAQDEAQHMAEQRQERLHARAEELHAARLKVLTPDDVAAAFEKLSGFKGCCERLCAEILADDPHVGGNLLTMLKSSFFMESFCRAMDEFARMDAEQNGELH